MREVGLIGAPTLSRQNVNEATALSVSTFYRAARVISDTVAGMPLKLYRKTDVGREEADELPLYDILRHEPNPYAGDVEFKSQMQFWAILYGAAFAYIAREGLEVTGLYPIHPGNVRVGRSQAGGRLFEVTTPTSKEVLADHEVLYLAGPSLDGTIGARLCQIARESLGLTMSLDQAGAAHFGNAMRPGVILEYPGGFGENSPARKNILESYEAIYRGTENTGRALLLEEGMKANIVPTSPEQSQYNESRQFQILEICRWVGVDPIFVFEYGRATWNNATQQVLNYLQFTIDPHLRRWESEIARKCITKADRPFLYPEFLRESIVRMDPVTQHQVWEVGQRLGIYSPGDIFRMQNRPVPDGADFYVWQKEPELEPVEEEPEQPEADEPQESEDDGDTESS